MSTPVQRRVDAHPDDGAVPTPWQERLRCLVAGASTHGAYSVGEVTTAPGWRRPTYVQHLVDETFYVATGAVHVVVDRAPAVVLTDGDVLHVPRGSARSLSREGDGEGRLLVVQTPGGLLEQPTSARTSVASGLELVEPV